MPDDIPTMQEVDNLPPPKRPKKKKVTKVETTDPESVVITTPTAKDEPPDTTLDSGDANGKFTPLEGAKVLMSVMATVHESRGHTCCAHMYERQKLPVAYALNELAKDSPMLQSWITHGKAFKVIAFLAAVEPLAEHQWRDHLRPSIQQRRIAQEEAYYAQNPESDPNNYDEQGNYMGPAVERYAPIIEEAPTVEQPFRGHAEQPVEPMTPQLVRQDYGQRPDGTTVAGNGAVVPAPARG